MSQATFAPNLRSIAWVWRAVVWFVLVGSISILAVAVLLPRAFGATPYTVLTGSMEPTMPSGTLIVAKPTPLNDIRIGDVVTYQIKSGEPEVATHRVVAIGTTIDGTRSLTTKGDANESPDRDRVIEEQIIGTVWYSIPHLGHVNGLLTGQQRHMVVTTIAVILVGYAAVMAVGAFREERS